MTNDDSPTPQGGGNDEKADFTGEENTGERSTPKKDLAAAIFLTVLSIVAMYYAWQLKVPDSILTAPGLLPFLTGLSLLAMAWGLGLKAVRQGAAAGFFDGAGGIVGGFFGDEENRRTLLLIGIIFAWVMIVGQITFDLRWPTPIHVFRFSSYEAISIPMLTLILRIFWRASLARCLVVSLIVIIALASAFRDGFKILLPEAG
jgi:hypothetical protein